MKKYIYDIRNIEYLNFLIFIFAQKINIVLRRRKQ